MYFIVGFLCAATNFRALPTYRIFDPDNKELIEKAVKYRQHPETIGSSEIWIRGISLASDRQLSQTAGWSTRCTVSGDTGP